MDTARRKDFCVGDGNSAGVYNSCALTGDMMKRLSMLSHL